MAILWLCSCLCLRNSWGGAEQSFTRIIHALVPHAVRDYCANHHSFIPVRECECVIYLKLPFERVWKSLCSCLLLCVCVPVHTWDCAMAQDLIQMTVNKNTALVLRPHSASRLKGCGLCGAAQISLTLRLKCLRVCMRDSWLNTPMLSTHTYIQLLVPFTHTNSRSAISELPEHGAFAINLHL